MRPEDVVSVGDEITVMVVEVDSQGRINLSRRAALSGEIPSAAEMDGERRGAGRGMGRPGGGNYGGGRRDNPNPNRASGGYNDRGGYSGHTPGSVSPARPSQRCLGPPHAPQHA